MPTTASRSPETMDVPDLIDHISAVYREVQQAVLPELIELARKVERVHQDVDDAPLGLAHALGLLSTSLDAHRQVEEQVLFPALRGKVTGAIAHPISLMRSEHEASAAELDAIKDLAHGFVPPAGACGSWRRLYAGVAGLCEILREQIRLEDKVLFPRFDVLAATRCTCAHS